MWITFRDVLHQEIWVEQSAIMAVLLPSPMTPGVGKCAIAVAPSLMCEVTRRTAEEVLASLTEHVPAADARLGKSLTLTQS